MIFPRSNKCIYTYFNIFSTLKYALCSKNCFYAQSPWLFFNVCRTRCVINTCDVALRNQLIKEVGSVKDTWNVPQDVCRNILIGTAQITLNLTLRRIQQLTTVRSMSSTNVSVSLPDDLEVKAFDEVFPSLLKDLTEGEESDIKEAVNWFHEVAQYNIPHGKKNRGLSVVMSYRELAGKNCTLENLRLARILGWCVEMVQAFFLVSDDIMDQSATRRGKLCWFRKDGVGLIAFNDAILIECGIFLLLKKHFRTLPCYSELIHEFHEVIQKTAYGQCLDMLSTPSGGKPKFESFTLDRYNTIVKYKTSYYSFRLPVFLAMHLAGVTKKEHFVLAEEILLKMGHFFQVQDDFLDCFGNPETTGKQGTDIEDGKCSWLVVTALQNCSPELKRILQENYGIQDEICVQNVKDIYDQLNLPDMYKKFEDNSFNELTNLIDRIPESPLPPQIFHGFLKKLYKRQK